MNNRLTLLIGVLCLAAHDSEASIQGQISAPTTGSAVQRGVLLSEQTTDLTLGDAVYLGLRNNRSIRSAYLQRVAQKFDLRVAEDAFSPQLTLNSEYRHDYGSSDRLKSATLSPTASLLSEFGTQLSMAWTQQHQSAEQAGRYRSDGLDLSIIQPLLRGAGRDVTTAPVRLARLNEQANRLNLKADVSNTISEIIMSYRELLRSQEQLSIADQALERARDLLEVNRALISAGRMAEFEVVQAEADIAGQELQVEEARNQRDIDRLSLLRLLALDLSTPIHASEALHIAPALIDRHDALRLAQSQQPEYLSTLLGSQQVDLNLLVAKNQGLWDVSLVGGVKQTRDRYQTDHFSSSGRQWDSYAGVQLKIPIGDLSSRQAYIQAQVAVENQALALEEARQTLEQSVNSVVRDLQVRWRQYEIAQRASELAKRKLAIEREKLQVGRSSNFQVISFEGDLRHAENSLLNARIAYLNAQTQLDRTLGMTLHSWDIALNDF